MGFFDMFKPVREETKSHIKNLIEMAMADGHFDIDEYDLLLNIGKRYGVTKSGVEKVKSDQMGIKFIVPTDAKERFKQLYDLVNMMVIDGFTDPSEKKLCSYFAKRFGYHPKKVDELVYSIAENISAGNSAEETFRRVPHLVD